MRYAIPVAASLTDAAREYEACERYVLYLRAAGVLRDEVEDPVLERMDDLWSRMTEEERQTASARVRTISDAAQETVLHDRRLAPGSHDLPREEAAA